jgi:hypothetical protein
VQVITILLIMAIVFGINKRQREKHLKIESNHVFSDQNPSKLSLKESGIALFNTKFGFWIAWFIITIVSTAVGSILSNAMWQGILTNSLWNLIPLLIFVSNIVFSALIGIGQAILLKDKIINYKMWIIFTMLFYGIFNILINFVNDSIITPIFFSTYEFPTYNILWIVIFSISMGFALGWMYWRMIDQSASGKYIVWIGLTILAMVMNLFIRSFLWSTPFWSDLSPTLASLIQGVLEGGIMGIVIGTAVMRSLFTQKKEKNLNYI